MRIDLIIFFSIILLMMHVSICMAEPLIVDHTAAQEFFSVPEHWIEKAKNDFHIAYGHTSHGQQLIEGLRNLDAFMTTQGSPAGLYSLNIDYDNPEETLDLRDIPWLRQLGWNQYGRDLGSAYYDGQLVDGDYTAWIYTTRKYLGWTPGSGDGSQLSDYATGTPNYNSDVNIVIWAWCGQVSYGPSEEIQNYLDNMSQLELDYPEVKFVYMTGHVDGTAITGNLHTRNEIIREYCKNNNKILYDFADIESYDPDGNYYGDRYITQACNYDYNGDGQTSETEEAYDEPSLPLNGDRNWALDWQNSHMEGVEWYQVNLGWNHTQHLSQNLKAYATWWLMARLAGWDGYAAVGGDFNGDCKVDIFDLAVLANAWSSESGSTNWNVICDLAPSGGDGVIDYKDLAILANGWLLVWDEPPSIISTPVTWATVGQLYTYQVYATGCPTPTYAITSFPTDMTIDTNTGLIQWYPILEGNYNITIEAINTNGVDIQNYTIDVSDELSPQIENLNITSTSGNDLSSDDLVCSYQLAGSAITAATAWYKNDSPYLVLLMPFEGGQSNALWDVSGNNVSVTIGGDPAWNPTGGYDGNGAFEFEGDDYLFVGNVFPTYSSYTKTAWIYRTGTSYNNIISSETYNLGGHTLRVDPDAKLKADHTPAWNIVQDSNTIEPNTWYFVSVTYDYSTGEMILYKNGSEVDRATVAVDYRDVTETGVLIGAIQQDFTWQGMIDEARIYNRALSAEQILALYNGGNVIVSSETSIGDQWQANVTPFSSTDIGITYPSNIITIK